MGEGSLALVLSSVAATALSGAPSSGDAYLDDLQGHWIMQGTLGGKQFTYKAIGQRVLDGAWLKLHMVDARKPPRYEADVFLGYDAKAHDFIVHWLDQFGAAGARVVGIEENRQAVKDAETNVRLNRIPQGRVRFISSRVEDGLERLAREAWDAVILDPPRQGCPPPVLAGAPCEAVRTPPGCRVPAASEPARRSPRPSRFSQSDRSRCCCWSRTDCQARD